MKFTILFLAKYSQETLKRLAKDEIEKEQEIRPQHNKLSKRAKREAIENLANDLDQKLKKWITDGEYIQLEFDSNTEEIQLLMPRTFDKIKKL